MSIAMCPFCDKDQSYRYIAENSLARAIYPKSPACDHHVLLVPIRHVPHWDQLTNEEMLAIQSLLRQLVEVGKRRIADFVGYNVLSNNGSPAVDQHVMHCHIHLFLRSQTDPNPLVAHKSQPKPLSETEKAHMEQLKMWLSDKGLE